MNDKYEVEILGKDSIEGAIIKYWKPDLSGINGKIRWEQRMDRKPVLELVGLKCRCQRCLICLVSAAYTDWHHKRGEHVPRKPA